MARFTLNLYILWVVVAISTLETCFLRSWVLPRGGNNLISIKLSRVLVTSIIIKLHNDAISNTSSDWVNSSHKSPFCSGRKFLRRINDCLSKQGVADIHILPNRIKINNVIFALRGIFAPGGCSLQKTNRQKLVALLRLIEG